ncbi:SDR family oxidoreductase [Dyella flagellata]|uniref:Short-chain dehydrogenase n=1 Tax=Dyella flagellata TaxID=1867833 RepID=A0ABQ5XCT9_9GAMM|nr:SDR family oxidoreductase [Dyella flagellata]GLQ89026.1 short-chain dehydrogenase [Dyella flagellata]
MKSLEQCNALVIGGSRGLGSGIVEALVARNAKVTVVARTEAALIELKSRTGAAVLAGDATVPEFAESTLRQVRPSVLILNAGATPTMALLHAQTWESFSEIWNTDVKLAFHWVQAALRLPLEQGSRVLLTASGAAIQGSPLSGGYAGAKRTVWLMADYANSVSKEQGLGIRFHALVPRQIVGATALGRTAAEAYARRQGKSVEEVLAGFGKPLGLRDYGEHVVTLLTQPQYENATSFGIRGDTGIEVLNP